MRVSRDEASIFLSMVRPNVDLTLGRRLRRRPNVKSTLGKCLLFAG